MPESEQTHRRTRKSDDEETVEDLPAVDTAHKAELDSDVDSILDEIDGVLEVKRPDDERISRSLHGLTRTLINNMVVGVTDG